MNELSAQEMQVTFEDIELKVRFNDNNQMQKWKTAIKQALG
jgi:hypothetical protein